MKKSSLANTIKTHIPELSEKLNLLFVETSDALTGPLQSKLEPSFNLFQADNIEQAGDIISKIDIQIIVCEEELSDGSGTEFLARLKKSHPNIVRIISGSNEDPAVALNAVNTAGIFKFLVAPWEDSAVEALTDAIEYYRTEVQNQFKDNLTGLKSAATILDILLAEIKRCDRYGSNLSVILVRVTNPKENSDLHDFLIDRLLFQKIAEILQYEVRGSDLGGRLTENHFLILLTETNESGALVFLNRFVDSVNKFDKEVNKGTLPFQLSTSRFTKSKDDKFAVVLDVVSELYERLV